MVPKQSTAEAPYEATMRMVPSLGKAAEMMTSMRAIPTKEPTGVGNGMREGQQHQCGC